MPVKQTIPFTNGTFFITFTCYNWLPLIEATGAYDVVYHWFALLQSKGHYINGYVIMPNHVHTLISFRETYQINTIIGNGKRFMAYEIIQRLQRNGEINLLQQLSDGVEQQRKKRAKKHNVWELSFDWKDCRSTDFANQKLAYMHNNPCTGKWNLSASPFDYIHSSMKFYTTGECGFPVTHIGAMQDISLSGRGLE